MNLPPDRRGVPADPDQRRARRPLARGARAMPPILFSVLALASCRSETAGPWLIAPINAMNGAAVWRLNTTTGSLDVCVTEGGNLRCSAQVSPAAS